MIKKSEISFMTSKAEPFFSGLFTSSSPILLIVAVSIALAGAVVAYDKNQAANMPEKTVAWFTANQQEARDQNKVCFENPALQSTPNCINSLHALEISYKGSNT